MSKAKKAKKKGDLKSAAQLLGRKGGLARTRSLSAKRLSEIGRKGAMIRHHGSDDSESSGESASQA